MSKTFTYTAINGTVTLAAGQYRKVSVAGVNGKKTSKTGTAFLTITEDGTASYTNRRGEITENIDAKTIIATYKTGIDTLMSGITEDAPMTVTINLVGEDEDRFAGYDTDRAEWATASV